MTASKPLVSMERSYALYAGGLGLILVVSLVLGNVPELAFSKLFDFPLRAKVSAGLFLAGAGLGAWAVHKHVSRTNNPWGVPQSQVTIPYLAFLVCSLAGLILSH